MSDTTLRQPITMHNTIEIAEATSTGLNEVVDTFWLDTGLFGLALLLVIIHLGIMMRQWDEGPGMKDGLFLLNQLGLLVAGGMFIFISKTF